MNRRILFLILSLPFLINPCAVLAQGQISVSDSLLIELLSPPLDTYTVDALNAAADVLIRNYSIDAYILADKAAQLADSLSFQKGKASAYEIMGRSNLNRGNYKKALLDIIEAVELYRELNDSLGLAKAYEGIADVNWRFGNYPEALDYNLKALRIREKYSDKVAISDSYYRLGIMHAEVFEYGLALDYYNRALFIARDLIDERRIANILNVIGRALRKQGKYDLAFGVHEESLSMYQKLGDETGISDYYNNVGSIYRRQGKYQEALIHFQKALDIQKKLNDLEGLADGYNDIGTTLSQQGKYSEAINYLQQGLEVAQKTGLKDDVRYAYSSLAATYDSLKNYRFAYQYYQLATEMKDSLLDIQKNAQLAQLHILYNSEKKEEEIKRLKVENQLTTEKQRKNRILGTSVVVFLILIALGLMYRSQVLSRSNGRLANKNRIIALEKERSDELLLNILPKETAEELKLHGKAKPRAYQKVSVMFVDFKGFTRVAEELTPRELVRELHQCFEEFDNIIARHGLEKIKTIGDAYMCAGGIPVSNGTHPTDAVRAGLEIQAYMAKHKKRKKKSGEPFFQARLGIHTGPVVAGIVGIKKFAYDIWGDTVNTAARMESSGDVGKVNISHDTYKMIQTQFICKYRGKVHAKNKGEIDMYFVEWEI